MAYYRRMREGAKPGRVDEAGCGGRRTRKGMGGLVLPMLRYELLFVIVITRPHGIFFQMALG